MTLAAWITVLSIVLVGSTGSGGAVFWLLNRKSQERQDEKVSAERDNTLADAAKKWQEILDASATAAYEKVEERCKRCETDLERVIAVVVPVLAGLRPILQVLPVQNSAVGDLAEKLHIAERELAKHV